MNTTAFDAVSFTLPTLMVLALPGKRADRLLLCKRAGGPLLGLFGLLTLLDQLSLTRLTACLVSGLLLSGGLLLALRSLSIREPRRRLSELGWALLLLLAASGTTPLLHEGSLLYAASGMTAGLVAYAQWLVADSEAQLGHQLLVGRDQGVASLLPEHAGLLLLCFLLLGSVPGSLLFMIEDVLLHDLFAEAGIYVVMVLLVTGLTSIASYQMYVEVFAGRSSEELPAKFRRHPPRRLKVMLLAMIIAGLAPAFFL